MPHKYTSLVWSAPEGNRVIYSLLPTSACPFAFVGLLCRIPLIIRQSDRQKTTKWKTPTEHYSARRFRNSVLPDAVKCCRCVSVRGSAHFSNSESRAHLNCGQCSKVHINKTCKTKHENFSRPVGADMRSKWIGKSSRALLSASESRRLPSK